MGRITKIFKKPLKLVRKWPEIQQEKMAGNHFTAKQQ